MYRFIQCLFLLFLVCAAHAAIPKSRVKTSDLSIEQLQEAAQAGDPDAQYALGYLYYYGRRVRQNRHKARNWIKRAAVQDQMQARAALAILNSQRSHVHAKKHKPQVLHNHAHVHKVPVFHSYYTIQLLASTQRAELMKYTKKHAHALGRHAVVHKRGHGYVLLYGHYKTHKLAVLALSKLPKSLKTHKPWVRKM